MTLTQSVEDLARKYVHSMSPLDLKTLCKGGRGDINHTWVCNAMTRDMTREIINEFEASLRSLELHVLRLRDAALRPDTRAALDALAGRIRNLPNKSDISHDVEK